MIKTLSKWLIFIISAMVVHGHGGATDWKWALYGAKATNFSNGLAIDYRRGYVNTSGELAIPGEFSFGSSDFSPTCAIVESDGKQALIDRSGNVLLEYGNYEFYKFDDLPNAYRVTDLSTGKKAYFNGTRFLTGFIYDYIFDFGGMIGMSGSGYDDCMNPYSEQIFNDSRAVSIKDYWVIIPKTGSEVRVFDNYGNPIHKDYSRSSEGIALYEDSITGKFGLKNQRGEIIVPAEYINYSKVWINDVVMLGDLMYYMVFDRFGKELTKVDMWSKNVSLSGDFYALYPTGGDASSWEYFDNNGRPLTQLNGKKWIYYGNNIYYYADTDEIYNAKTGKITANIHYPSISENMMRYYSEVDGNKQYHYMDLSSGKVIGPYEYGEPFREGLAVVRIKINGKDNIIDMKGKLYPLPANIEIKGNYFSEGVISAYDKDAGIYGFLYNPLGHDGYVYNQSGGNISDYAYERKHQEAVELCNNGNYAKAKDIFYFLAMVNPDNILAFDYYAYCLYKLGYLDEAETAIEVALTREPDHTYALDLQESIRAEKRAIAESQNYYEAPSAPSVWDAILGWANAISGVAGNILQMTGSAGSGYSSDYSGGYESAGSVGGGNYQAQYDNWARIAEKHYNSLTNLGYSSSGSGGRRGNSGQGASGGNYVRQKKALREAQREMRKIRQQARRAGVNIIESEYENASVSY